MTNEPAVSTGTTETEYRYPCGWVGAESALDDWDVQSDRDRVVRVCPACESAVPGWGCLSSLDGVRSVAEGNLRSALAERD